MSDAAGIAGSAAPELRKDFLVVGLGGSAGAIPAFREFFRHVPPDSGMAYVVILHLSPAYDSHLAEVLQGSSAIPVTQVRERVKVEPNHVYVIPPNRSLAMIDGSLVLSPITGFEERRAPVDIFFRTLGEAHDARAVCVILSGSGSDGSMGLRRVKEHNGLVLVQEPTEAQFDEMPRHSIATGLADMVLPVADMPARIIAYRDQVTVAPLQFDDSDEKDEQALIDIFTSLRVRTGHDFSNYKRATVLRRIERRMALHALMRLPDYALFLREHSDEPELLLRELLISVTNFFRDTKVWETVEQNVVTNILQGKGAEDHVRVWVAGCATGEEAYSVAMLLSEAAAELPSPPNIQIFATDLDEDAIAKARNGCYSPADVADVSPERLRRHFVREQDDYRVRRELRELILFAHHNLLKDPPFSHIDFVSCRNVLIYLNRTAQERMMEVLHFALEPGGWLLLGTAESSDCASQLFSVSDKEAHLYQSRAVPRVVSMPTTPRQLTISSDLRAPQPPDRREQQGVRFTALDLHLRLIEEYASPSLIIDEAHNIVHLSDRAGRYLQFAAGEASLNVLQVVRPELRIALRTALLQSAETRGTVFLRGVEVHTGERSEVLNLIVRPTLREGDGAAGYFLVLFEPSLEPASSEAVPPPAGDQAVRQLEDELVRVKSQMRGTTEQYEIQAEEAKAANEELQAINEELRSTAEELETSQEELQSLNEELQTVNQELKVKIEEIGHTNDDLRNLMSSTEIGTIFVDRSQRVKLFTPRVRDIFSLIPADVGRPLLDIISKLTSTVLAADLDAVLDRLHTIEREVESRDGCWYLMRLLPYRTAEDRIDGVVLTFLEVTEQHRAHEVLRETQQRQAYLLKLSDALRDVGDPAEIQATASRVLGEHLGASRAYYVEIDEPAGEYVVARDWHQQGETSHARRYPLASWPMPWLADGRTWSFTDAETDRALPEGQRDAYRENAIGAAVVVPLVRRGKLVATFVANQRRPRAWTAHEIGIVEETADRTWAALQRARAEVALRASEERLQRMVNVPSVGVLTFDAGETIVHANDAFLEMVGYSREEFSARRFSWRDFTPDEYVEASLDVLARMRETGRGGPYEKEYFRRDGSRVWFMFAGADLGDGMVVEYAFDVTGRKQAEAALRESQERYRTLFESIDQGFCIIDMLFDESGKPYDYRFVEVNPAFERQTGLSDAVGRTMREMVPEHEAYWYEMYGRIAQTAVPARFENVARGLGRVYEVYAFRFGDSRHRIAVLFNDITARKQVEDKLEQRVRERTRELAELSVQRQQLLKRLVAATEEERQRIARELHDEMGQHLTALRVVLQTAQASGDGTRHLSSIVDRLDQSVDRLTLELRPPALDHLGLHGAIASLAEAVSATSGVRVDVHLPGVDGERFGDGIEIAIYRVVQEALTNVWKHSGAKTVSVIVERDRDALRLIVEDDGRGFEGDGALDGESARGRFGLLGMRERLAVLGGSIRIESQPDSGTTIYVRVPLSDPAVQ